MIAQKNAFAMKKQGVSKMKRAIKFKLKNGRVVTIRRPVGRCFILFDCLAE